MNHPCDGRTDGQTDGIAIAYARLQHMLSRAKTNRWEKYRPTIQDYFPKKQVKGKTEEKGEQKVSLNGRGLQISAAV